MKMQLLRWNNAEPTPRPDTRPASSMVTGAGCRGENPRLRRREKNVLDNPFYRSGVSLVENCPTARSMHYEKAPPLQKVAAVMGAASAPLRCAGASLRYGGA